VLKPSGDGSEDVIRSYPYSSSFREGELHKCGADGDRQRQGDVILFPDDDAVAEERWVEKYENLFNSLPNVGGISGVTYKAYIENDRVVKTYEPFYDEKPPRNVFYGRPLPEYLNYHGWIACSGFMGAKAPPGDVFLSALLGGVNMGLLRDAVKDCPLAYLYMRSRKGLWNEQKLAYCAKKKGYDTNKALGPRAPSVWHIVHADKGEGVLARVLGPLRQSCELLAA